MVDLFDRVDPVGVQTGDHHPRGITAWPKVGRTPRAKNRRAVCARHLGAVVAREPAVDRDEDHWCRITGTFYRAVERARRSSALDGSHRPGRCSAAGQPTLYLSSTPQGVAAALAAYGGARRDLVVLRFAVQADRLVDLCDPAVLLAAGVDVEDAIAPWQDVVAAGGTPRPWTVRRRREEAGAVGLVDPRRNQPGLWHVTLFRWNAGESPRVTALDHDGGLPMGAARG